MPTRGTSLCAQAQLEEAPACTEAHSRGGPRCAVTDRQTDVHRGCGDGSAGGVAEGQGSTHSHPAGRCRYIFNSISHQSFVQKQTPDIYDTSATSLFVVEPRVVSAYLLSVQCGGSGIARSWLWSMASTRLQSSPTRYWLLRAGNVVHLG